jgi:hypothetical protein
MSKSFSFEEASQPVGFSFEEALGETPFVEKTQNPLKGALGRAAGLTGSFVEAVAEVGERVGDYIEKKVPISQALGLISEEELKEKQLQPLFDIASGLKKYEKDIGYAPSTKLKDLGENPLKTVPFIAERVISSSPDMAAAVASAPAYIMARTKEILDERVKNDNKTLDDATVGDVAAAAGAAAVEATLERFATKGLLKKGGAEAKTTAGRVGKEAGVQSGTEAAEETAAYAGETVGTKKGFSFEEAGERALEGAIVGGGLGATVQGGKEVFGQRPQEIKDPRISEAIGKFGAEETQDERGTGQVGADAGRTEPSIPVPPRGDEATTESVIAQTTGLGTDIQPAGQPAGGAGEGDAALAQQTPTEAQAPAQPALRSFRAPDPQAPATPATTEVTPAEQSYESLFKTYTKDPSFYEKYGEVKSVAKQDYATASDSIKKLESKNQELFSYLKQSGIEPSEYLAAGSSKTFEGLNQEQKDALTLLGQGISEIQSTVSDIRFYETELAKAQEQAKTKEKVEGEEKPEEKENIQGVQRRIEGNRQAKLLREKFAADQKALATRVDAGVSNADRFLQDPTTYDRRDDAVVDYDTGEVTPGRALMFSRQAEEKVKGSKKADVEAIVKDLISDWENAPRIEVVQSISELPPDVQQQIKREGVNPKGLYVTKTKDVFLIADNLVNRTDTIMTAVHEAIGHFGMRSILGDKRDAVMREIYKGNKEVRDAVDELRKGDPKMSLELAVEEVMAEMAYTSLQKYYSKKRLETSKPLRQLMQIIRRVLSQFPGIRMNAVSDLDVMELIANASRFVRKGEIKYDRFTEGKVREAAPTKKEPAEDKVALTRFTGRAGAGRVAPVQTPPTWEKATSYLNPKNLMGQKTPARQLLLKTFTLRMLKDMVGDSLNGVKNAITVTERMATTRNQIMKTGGEILDKKIFDLNKKDPDQLRLLGEIAVEATRRGIDPDTQTGKDLALDNAWRLMTDDAKKTYRAIRGFYEDQINGIIGDLKDRIREVYADNAQKQAEALAAIDSEFTSKLTKPYFPLRRFGNYWFQVGSDTNKEFYMFESEFDRNFWMKERQKELEAAGRTEEIKSGNSIREGADSANNAMADSEVFKKIDSMFDSIVTPGRDPNAIKDELKDSLKQLVYLTLPQNNFRRMFINRKGIQGASTDIPRVFSGSVVNIAYQRARLKHSSEYYNAVNGAFGELEGMPSGNQKNFLTDVAMELESRTGHVLGVEPTTPAHKAANLATQFTFLWMLTAPASALVNVLGAGSIGGSYIGARYGYLKTTNKMLQYMKLHTKTIPKAREGTTIFPTLEKSTELNDLQKAAYERFLHDNAIDVTLQHDLAGVSEKPSQFYTGTMNKAVQAMSSLFHNSERASREVLSMAAFDLAYEKAKADGRSGDAAFEFAIQEAKDLVMMSVGDFTRASKPPALTGPVTKIVFQFKQYSLLMTYNLLRNAYVGLKPRRNATAEEKAAAKEARRRMAGVLGTTFLFAGLKGMPIFTVGMMAIEVFSMLPMFDDEDEIENGEEWLYGYLEDTVGADSAQALMRGVVSKATNVALTERTSLDLADLWFRDSGNQKTNEDEARAWLINLMGPTVSLGLSVPKAVDLASSGQTDRALETLMPTVARSVMISARYAEEGAKTARGVVIKPEEDITYTDLFVRGLGFTPDDIMQKQKELIARKGIQQKIELKRERILTGLFIALDSDDDELYDKFMEKLDEFNDKYPEVAIKQEQLQRSLQQRIKDRVLQQELGGVDKKLYERLSEEVRER